MPMPAEQDHADCDSPLIHVSGWARISMSTLNMKMKPSKVPSFPSIISARARVRNSIANRESIM